MPVRLPAEWEPQSAILLTWPHPGSDWDDALAEVYGVFASIGAAVAADQRVLNVCQSATHRETVDSALRAAGAASSQLLFAVAPSNDSWARDHGPLVTLDDAGPVINDFVFDGWGGKFAADDDNRLCARLHAQGVFGTAALRRHHLVLEGGAIEADGRGTLLATRSSVLDPNRNPGLDRQAIEAILSERLGFRRFLWLDQGALSGDDTDGHIDTLVRFTDPATLIYQTVSADHPDRQALEAMAIELARLRNLDDAPYRLVALPCPGRHVDETGRPLPASYANFLITNRCVLLPTYGATNDADAANVLAGVFPDRRIVPIDCRAIIRQNGSLHCLTMQLPADLDLEEPASDPRR